MISTDRAIFDEKSDVRARQIEYAKEWEEVHIVIFCKENSALLGSRSFSTTIGSARRTENSPSRLFSRRRLEYDNSQSSGAPKGFRKNDCQGVLISENCWLYSTESFSKFLFPFDAVRIGKNIVENNKITNITCQDSSLTAYAGVSLKRKYKIPLEIQIHEDLGSPNYAYNLTNKIRLFLANHYIPKADNVRVVSFRIKKYVEELLEKKRLNKDSGKPVIETRPISVDLEKIRNSPTIVDLYQKYRQFDKIVLMASRLEKEKNVELAIKAWKKVNESFPKAGLLIVGRGSKSVALQSLPARVTLAGSIIFEDWVPKPTLFSYYKTADLFLNTSLFEGYGLTLVEAEAAGCPIVSTDVGIAGEVGANITSFEPDDVANKIIQSLK